MKVVVSQTPRRASRATSVDKALNVCEVLSGQPDGLSVSELAQTLELPVSTVHRGYWLLAGLRTRGYVRQDEVM